MARSTDRRLVLINVGVSAAGRYKCEVIGEGPGFLTADRSAYMKVVREYWCGKEDEGERRDGIR